MLQNEGRNLVNAAKVVQFEIMKEDFDFELLLDGQQKIDEILGIQNTSLKEVYSTGRHIHVENRRKQRNHLVSYAFLFVFSHTEVAQLGSLPAAALDLGSRRPAPSSDSPAVVVVSSKIILVVSGTDELQVGSDRRLLRPSVVAS